MSFLHILFLALIGVPILEIYLLIQVGGLVGAIPTIALVVFTAVLGALLLRFQGLVTLNRVRQSMERGELPAIPMLEGVVLLFCGVLLLTPGFFTDAIGFLGLVPPLRQALVRAAIARGVVTAGSRRSTPGDHHGPRTLEGEYRREKD